MHGTNRQFSSRKGGAAFLFWAWAMLVVVLLSATPTSAQPRTRLVGSAFDPASVSVLVSPRKPKPDQGIRKSAESDPTGVACGDSSEAAVRLPLLMAVASFKQAVAPPLEEGAPRRWPVRAYAARAPPLA